jgi:RHS repeat-associated protein
LVSVSEGNTATARMAYAADGFRVVRREGTKTTLYVAGAEISLADGGTASAVRYYSLAGLAVAMRTGNDPGQTTTLAPDWQNTVRHQIDNATGELRTSLQTPYGGVRGGTPAGWAGERGFVGGVKDATGLTRIGARDYDPVLERFVTVDPELNLFDPLGWNAYLYANNTPVTLSDSTGRNWWGDFVWQFKWQFNKLLDSKKPMRASPIRGQQGWRPPGTHGTYRDTWNAVGGAVSSTLFTSMGRPGATKGSTKPSNPTHLQEFEKQFVDTLGFEKDTVEYQVDGPLLALVGGAVASMIPGGGAAGAKSIGGGLSKLGKAAKSPKPPAIKAGSAGGPSAGKGFSKGVRNQELANNPDICVYCRMDTISPQVDHAIPKSRGGNATIENAQTACPHCNASKGARDFPVTAPPGFVGDWPPGWWPR